jgi:sugar lactone lactonase YvrE
VVNGRGNIYLNGIGLGFLAGEPPTPGIIALVTPDGAARKVAGDLEFPNGMVITPDDSTLIISESFAGRLTAFDIAADGSLSNRRAWAEGLGPDGICMDADGAVWVETADTREHTGRDDAPEAVVRIREGGEVLGRIEHDRVIFAAMLRGPDCTTLFLLGAQWRGIEHVDDTVAARTGQILITKAPAPVPGAVTGPGPIPAPGSYQCPLRERRIPGATLTSRTPARRVRLNCTSRLSSCARAYC